MPNTIFTPEHKVLVQLLVDARKRKGLNQTEVGQRLGKNQKFISLIEQSQRRVDVLEFSHYSLAMGYDPAELYRELLQKLDALKISHD